MICSAVGRSKTSQSPGLIGPYPKKSESSACSPRMERGMLALMG